MIDPRRPFSLSVVALALLLVSVGAAARAPEEAEPTMSFRGPDGAVHHAGRRIARPPSVVPLDHWSYPLLSRLVTRGVIDLDLTTLPVSRRDVLEALERIDPRLTGIEVGREPDASGHRAPGVTARERWLIERLAAEFDRAAVDSPTAYVRDGDAQVGLGIELGVMAAAVAADEPETTLVGATPGPDSISAGSDSIRLPGLADEFGVDASARYEVWGGFGESIGFSTRATILFHGQEGERIEGTSMRARAWRGMTADITHGYVMVERPRWRVTMGRFGAAWARSDAGRLLLSGNAPTLDGYEVRASVGPLVFTVLHAMLEYHETGEEADFGDDERVFVAGHRLAAAGRSLSVGLNEIVIYSGGIPDPIYLNPFAPYYVSQHNERADDNILWSLDADWRPRPGHELYTELLADDLQYDRNTDNPDKYAGTFGYRYAGALPRGPDIEVTVEYSHARKWVYTHKRVEHRSEHDGSPLGFDLGPDADRLLIDALLHPGRRLSLGFRYARERKGEGSIRIPYDKATDDPDTAFPSGDVRTVDSVHLSLDYDDLDGFTSGLSVGYYRVEGRDPVDGSIWEVTGHVGFRI